MAAVWLLGDFGYSRYIHYRIYQWEKAVPWTESGLAPDAAEYTLPAASAVADSVGLLMVHGFSDSPQVFRKLAPALAERGFTCRAVLLPGFGRDVGAYQAVRLHAWQEKLVAEVGQMKQAHSSVWLMAHSLGGALAMDYALEHPGGIDGLILMAPAVKISDARSPLFGTRFWHQFSKMALPFSSISCTPFEMDAWDPREREREHRQIFTPRSVVDATIELLDSNRPRAAELHLPLLCFLPAEDHVIDSQATRRFLEDCASEHKRIVSLPRSRHMIPVDYDWSQVVDEISEFVAQSDALAKPLEDL